MVPHASKEVADEFLKLVWIDALLELSNYEICNRLLDLRRDNLCSIYLCVRGMYLLPFECRQKFLGIVAHFEQSDVRAYLMKRIDREIGSRHVAKPFYAPAIWISNVWRTVVRVFAVHNTQVDHSIGL